MTNTIFNDSLTVKLESSRFISIFKNKEWEYFGSIELSDYIKPILYKYFQLKCKYKGKTPNEIEKKTMGDVPFKVEHTNKKNTIKLTTIIYEALEDNAFLFGTQLYKKIKEEWIQVDFFREVTEEERDKMIAQFQLFENKEIEIKI